MEILTNEKLNIESQKNIIWTKKDYSISIIRLISLISIVVCHIFQYYNISLAWNFNIGVQLFLIISGFLYGLKFKNANAGTVWKNFKKIFFDYYIFIILAIILNLVFNISGIDFKRIILMFFFAGNIKGVEHLWYVPLILFCYLEIPFLSFFKSKIQKNKLKNLYKIIFLIIVVIINSLIFSYFNAAWVLCFNYAYLFAEEIKDIKKYFVRYNIIGIVLVALIHGLRCFTNIFDNMSRINQYININDFIKTLTAIVLFITLYFLFSFIKYKDKIKFLDFADKYSYDVYLTHQIFILGPLSLLSITRFNAINICLSLICIVALTVALIGIKYLIILITKKIKEKRVSLDVEQPS